MTIELIEPQTLQGAAQQASSGVALQQQRRGDIVGAGASLNDTARLIHVIAEAASNPAIDVDKMERLFAELSRGRMADHAGVTLIRDELALWLPIIKASGATAE